MAVSYIAAGADKAGKCFAAQIVPMFSARYVTKGTCSQVGYISTFRNVFAITRARRVWTSLKQAMTGYALFVIVTSSPVCVSSVELCTIFCYKRKGIVFKILLHVCTLVMYAGG